jgi:hypothetical protein
MGLEVVAEFAPRENHCVEQLLDLWVARLGVGQDFADVVHRRRTGKASPSSVRYTTITTLATWVVATT